MDQKSNAPIFHNLRLSAVQEELDLLGFVLEEEDHKYLSRKTSEAYIKRFNMKNTKDWLFCTISYLGLSLKKEELFTFIADNVSNTVMLEEQVKDVKGIIEAQRIFFSKLVHELRTPLSGMMGMSSLLKSTIITGEQEGMIKLIQTCGDSLLLLIGNLLDLSNYRKKQL